MQNEAEPPLEPEVAVKEWGTLDDIVSLMKKAQSKTNIAKWRFPATSLYSNLGPFARSLRKPENEDTLWSDKKVKGHWIVLFHRDLQRTVGLAFLERPVRTRVISKELHDQWVTEFKALFDPQASEFEANDTAS